MKEQTKKAWFDQDILKNFMSWNKGKLVVIRKMVEYAYISIL